MKKLVVVENIKTIREGLKIFIDRFSDFECSHSFDSFEGLKKQIDVIKPDIILADLNMKGVSSVTEIREIKTRFPHIVIILLTMNEEEDKLFKAMLNGASAYLNKNSPSNRLIKTLKEISAGKIQLNSLIARRTISYINEKNLTQNYQEIEIELLNKVIEGNNLLAIAKSLGVSRDQIKIMFYNIYQKIHKFSTRDLAA